MSTAETDLRGLAGRMIVRETPQALAEAAAELLSLATESSAAARGAFTIALSGGTSPRLLYETLARPPWRESIPWETWRVYFSDERASPPDDAASNYHMARKTLLDRVPIDPEHVHRMPADSPDLDAAARTYDALLEHDLPRGPGNAPRFDCVLLGLGENGHTASLFPSTPALAVADRWVTRGQADYAPFDRLTLTFPTLNAAALVVFLVTGASKHTALRATAEGTTPASRVHPADGVLVWLLDSPAAGTTANQVSGRDVIPLP